MRTEPDNPKDPLRILMVEDVSADAELELRELRRDGLRFSARIVELERNFRKELEIFEPDVILSDFSLPHFSGMEVLSIARELRPDIPFIFVSGTIGEENAVQALKNGATDYLLKTNLKRFPAAVRRAIVEARERKARQLAEQQAKDTTHYFSLFMRYVPATAFAKDLDGRFTFANPTFEKLVGKAEGGMLGLTTRDLYPPELAEPILANDRKVIETKQPFRAVEKVKMVDVERSYLVTKFPIENERGDVTMLGGISLDITEQLQAEEALAKSEERFRGIVETTEERIWECDLECRMTYNNPALTRILGYTPAEVLGKSSFEFLDAEDREFQKRVTRTLSTGDGWRGVVVRVRHKDGSLRWLDSNGRPLFDADGRLRGFRGADRDVTERVNQEVRVRRLSRMQAVLSAINAAIVRVQSLEDLLTEACRILMEKGHLKLVWAGVVAPGTQDIRPFSVQGEPEENFTELNLQMGMPESYMNSVALTAVRRGHQIIINDVVQEGLSKTWSQRTLERGLRSVAALPLHAGGNIVAVIALFAAEPNFFDEEEVKLVSDLAADLSFALDHLAKQAKLDYLAYYDSLTDLANRTLFLDRLSQSLTEMERRGNVLAVMLMDLERFGAINESLGRHAGDMLLKLVAERLRRLYHPEQVARFGMNSFAVILPGIAADTQATTLIESAVRNFLADPFSVEGTELRLAAKFGISLFRADAKDADGLLRNAEAALKRAKNGGDTIVYYEPRFRTGVAERLALETKLRRAIDENQFVLHYQPKVDIDSRELLGLEALIRWQDPETGLIPPYKFIPILEETGMILDLGRWVLQEAARAHLRWRKQGYRPPRIAVNVSSIQLRQKNFATDIADIVAASNAEWSVDVEITESVMMENIDRSIAMFHVLRETGLLVSMDDFGTGYSSLSYLARLPIDYLKIDRSFITKINSDTNSRTIVAAIISMTHALNLTVIAEGVENEAQLGLLKRLQCDQFQGYLIGPGEPEDRVVKILAS